MHIVKSFFVLILISDCLMASQALVSLPTRRSEIATLFQSGARAGSRIITMQNIEQFNIAADSGMVHQFLDEIIPKANLTGAFIKDLYTTWRTNPFGFADSIIENTVDMGVNVADDIAHRFFDVSCDSVVTRDAYIAWLRDKLLPTIELVYQERISRIMQVIESQRSWELANLGGALDTWYTRQYHADREIRDARFNQELSLMVMPVLGYSQSLLYESRALRWVSYTACAGLTVTLLYKYFSIIQSAQQRLLTIKMHEDVLKEEMATLSERLLPNNLLNEKTRKLIEALNLKIQISALQVREQVRQELREPVRAEAGPVVSRRTINAVTGTLAVFNGFTRLMDNFRK